MVGELIRLDKEHISVEQMKMLDPKLISALIERWRPETYTFTLPCGECTITLEDMQLQLGLLVDGYIVTGSAQSTDWGAPDNDSTELERIRYALAYILEMIGGYLMSDLSRNLIHLRWLLKLVDFRAADELSLESAMLAKLYKEMCRATRPNKAKIGGCLSLLQLWARFCFPFLRPRFQWTPYEDLAIRAVISDEFFQNPNIWHVKVSLVNYATVEMYQSDRVLRQFGFRQPFSMAPKVLDDKHKVDLRIHCKPYLLSEDERRWQIRVQKERRGPLTLKRRANDAGPSIAPTQSPGPSPAPTQSSGPTLKPMIPIS
ncbi:hypothetical protein CXB51_016688 [Gossypium anomalum]|uniref:Aminotransferase-like plant mobile domain-containing protein n=1 Tax=Gossypium anomalum TaxID=47600 RepID=A0A8J5YEI2_9ROSI|nr:hypothetical protein CXB51_016688 [Gossypium anomalum]